MFSVQFPIPAAANTSFRSSNLISEPRVLLLSRSCPNSCKANSSVVRFRLGEKQRCALISGSVENDDNIINETEMAGVDPEAKAMVPQHVAVIMDGNRRWAKSKGLSVSEGHRAGGKAMEKLYMNCLKNGVKVLTVFAFSTENWVRPQEEVIFLMDLFQECAEFISEKTFLRDVRLSFIGNREQLPKDVQKLMFDAEELTKNNRTMHLVMAMNYSGRYDIIQATRKIVTKVKHGVLQVEDVDDAIFEQHLGTNVIDEFPNPDLMIRSSGELRVSNFMLWQLAYTEMFFTEKMFPDFDDADFVEAITAFQRRQRRFGGHKY